MNFKVGEIVSYGLLDAVILKIYTFKGQEWATLDLGSGTVDVQIKHITKAKQ